MTEKNVFRHILFYVIGFAYGIKSFAGGHTCAHKEDVLLRPHSAQVSAIGLCVILWHVNVQTYILYKVLNLYASKLYLVIFTKKVKIKCFLKKFVEKCKK